MKLYAVIEKTALDEDLEENMLFLPLVLPGTEFYEGDSVIGVLFEVSAMDELVDSLRELDVSPKPFGFLTRLDRAVPAPVGGEGAKEFFLAKARGEPPTLRSFLARVLSGDLTLEEATDRAAESIRPAKPQFDEDGLYVSFYEDEDNRISVVGGALFSDREDALQIARDFFTKYREKIEQNKLLKDTFRL